MPFHILQYPRSCLQSHRFSSCNSSSDDSVCNRCYGPMALQVQSEFQKAYDKGIPKSKFWEPTCEHSLNLIAQVPIVASYVYRRIYKGGDIIPADDSLDYGANFYYMLGLNSPKMQELMRLYVTIYSNHEGGDVSAHTAHLGEFMNCQDCLQG